MLMRLSRSIDQIASTRNLLLLFLSLLPFVFLFFPWRTRQLEASAGHPVRLLDTRLPYKPKEVHALAGDLGVSGRRLYAASEVTLDFAFPALYATWLSVTLAWVWRQAHPGWAGRSWLAMLPYLGMLSDWGENACSTALMLLFPNEPSWLVWLSNLASLAKWSAGLASFGMILAGLGVWGTCLFQRGKT